MLSKECEYNVTATTYRDEAARDAFINGLLSSNIRQRLLEINKLTLDKASTQAHSLDLAQKHSLSYPSNQPYSTCRIFPRTLNCSERKHSSIEKEAYAIVEAI